jgi:hypothetical protein
MNVHFDKSPTVLQNGNGQRSDLRSLHTGRGRKDVGRSGVDKRSLMSYPYRVMPDVKLSHNAALLVRTICRRHAKKSLRKAILRYALLDQLSTS